MNAPHEETNTAPLSPGQTAELADMFRLMGDASRLRIVLACLDGPVAVGDIAARLGLSPSLVSHHLRLLRAGRILKATREGKQVFYAAADAHISRVVADMVAHVGETLRDGEIP
ncbi:MAG: winged helix-turn-helix transcriptional regulator [Proteobacteria bacterium]|nr:winged helix-turn-helix transcriptional regulator [Pseudomonadota bacterium]